MRKTHQPTWIVWIKAIMLPLIGGYVSTGHAQDTLDQPTASDVLSHIHVIGSRDDIYSIPGSAHYIDHEDLRANSYDDINRVLRQVPGIYLREEDGYGLFPNIRFGLQHMSDQAKEQRVGEVAAMLAIRDLLEHLVVLPSSLAN